MTPDSARDRERWRALRHFEHWLERPMVFLGFVWLGLLVVEFTRGIGPILGAITTFIWIVFVVEFVVRLLLAPARWTFLRRNVVTLVALVLPAFRVLRLVRVVRVARLARVTRSLRLVRVVTTLNRGMATLGRVMRRRGFGYVVILTLLVAFGGGAGMLAFERDEGLPDYGSALWWTAMMLTTMGSEYWPRTVEGRALTLLLALYAFTVFGYVTATLATLFVEQDRVRAEGTPAGARGVEQLRAEILALRTELEQFRLRAPRS
jgi:voltage-gated potassium channel